MQRPETKQAIKDFEHEVLNLMGDGDEQFVEFATEAMSGDYHHLLRTVSKYVEIS